MNINCYYDVEYNEKRKKVILKIALENDLNKTIYKRILEFNIKNMKRLYMEGLTKLFYTLEELEAKRAISSYDKMIIHVDSFNKIPILSKFEMLKGNNTKAIENLKAIYGFYQNWAFNLNKMAKELFEEAFNRKQIRNKDEVSKKSLVVSKMVKVAQANKPRIVRKISDLMKGKPVEIIFFDTEMNCGDSKKDTGIWETVSIGAVKVSSNGKIGNTFYAIIKPSKQPVLSRKCKELTGLIQEDINNAISFKEAMRNFDEWVGDNPAIFASWGREDIRVLKKDNKYNGFRLQVINRMRRNYIDFQKELCEYYLKLKNVISLIKALNLFSFSFEGTQHNALDDAVNLARIYIRYKDNLRDGKAEII